MGKRWFQRALSVAYLALLWCYLFSCHQYFWCRETYTRKISHTKTSIETLVTKMEIWFVTLSPSLSLNKNNMIEKKIRLHTVITPNPFISTLVYKIYKNVSPISCLRYNIYLPLAWNHLNASPRIQSLYDFMGLYIWKNEFCSPIFFFSFSGATIYARFWWIWLNITT